MFLINKKQYILKMSSGQLMNIYYKSYTGLSISKQKINGTWSSPAVILKGAMPGFCVHLDSSDNIHILCQDEKSNLLYISCKNNSWSVRPVSRSKIPDIHDKYPYICTLAEDIYFFYMIDTSGKRILFCQKCNGDGLSAPKAIDYVDSTSKTYTVLDEADGNLYVFYTKSEEKHNAPGYIIINANREAWSDFITLNSCSSTNGDQILSASADRYANLHICMQRSSEHKFELVYMKTHSGESNCSETVLASSPYSFANSSVLCLGNRLIVYWVREDRIFYCVSIDNGIIWSKPEKFNFSENEVIHCVRFLTNCPDDSVNTRCMDIPANISEGFKPAFINNFADKKEDNAEMEELKNMLLNTIDAISSSINEINKRIKSMDERMDKLESSLQQVCVNLEKAVEANRHIEEAVSKVKALNPGSNTDTKSNRPMITGTGFSQITYDYLKNIDKK